ncbi:MAG: family 78 glycoside hydrolase catalytic domain, partial [Clostridia bacterium]|nr:family 78 glycoside hydrolase catalytic domain [Clostridia bacterium]
RSAAVTRGPGGVLLPDETVPVRLCGTKELIPDEFGVCDVGYNITGNAEIKVRGKKGQYVVLLYSERLREDFTPDRFEISNLVKSERFAQDEYILSGDGVETWHSDFGFHGFRYILVRTNAQVLSVTAREVHTDLQSIGDYVCDNPRVNALHPAVLRSTLTNFVHIPTDCPPREKNGWTADAMLSSEQALFNLDMYKVYLKWLDDIVDSQRPNGAISCICPSSGVWGYGWGSGVTWDAALFVIPYNMYLFSGNKAYLERYYEPMKKYLRFLYSCGENDIYTIGLGDWVPPTVCCTCSEKYPHASDSCVLTAYAALTVGIFAKVAFILGKEEDGKQAEQWAERIKSAFLSRFDGKEPLSQTYLALKICLGLSSDIQKDGNALITLIHSLGDRLFGGIFGVRWIPEALVKIGEKDLAWKIVTAEGYPGFFYMMDKASGTLPEGWEGQSSQNHHMYSCVDAFVFSCLSGIGKPDAYPGFTHLEIEPYFPRNVSRFSSRHRLPCGEISVDWDEKSYIISLPEGVTANVTIGNKTVKANGKTVIA